FPGQEDLQAAVEQKLRRIGEEGGEVVESDVQQLRLRPGERAGEKRRRVRAGLADGIAGAAVFPRVTEQAAAGLEVFLAEGLETVVDEEVSTEWRHSRFAPLTCRRTFNVAR